MPISPPTTQSSTASMRNCSRMSRCRAPSALRSPISRVRSRTLTSMMFETPTPPTSSEIAAMAASTRVSRPRMRPIVPRIWVCVTAENSSPSYFVLQRRDQPALQRLDVVGASAP